MTGFFRQKKSGFTLVELLIVVAIIGILAAIAIPQMLLFIAKARRTEGVSIMQGFHKSQIAYYAAKDTFAGAPGPMMAWPADLGYAPSGQMKFYYLDGEDSLNFHDDPAVPGRHVAYEFFMRGELDNVNDNLIGTPHDELLEIYSNCSALTPGLSLCSGFSGCLQADGQVLVIFDDILNAGPYCL